MFFLFIAWVKLIASVTQIVKGPLCLVRVDDNDQTTYKCYVFIDMPTLASIWNIIFYKNPPVFFLNIQKVRQLNYKCAVLCIYLTN